MLAVKKVLVLAGDGIGVEVIAVAEKVLDWARECYDIPIDVEHGLVGGASIDDNGSPLSDDVLARARGSAAVLLGAVGGSKWDSLARTDRPENGLLRLRSELGLFANLRPTCAYSQLLNASSLKPSYLEGFDVLIVRELTGGLYYGTPRGIRENDRGVREAYNTLHYGVDEIERIARVAFDAAMKRRFSLCSVDKANVLEASMLWREVVGDVARDYPKVELSHMYVDNAAMQLVCAPTQFDVILTENLFGDVLSDLASVLTGSIGMLASASLDGTGFGMYEPCHGAAPDIAGQDKANPLAAVLSVAMLLRYSLGCDAGARAVEAAVAATLDAGYRTADIATSDSEQLVGCEMMGEFLLRYLRTARPGADAYN